VQLKSVCSVICGDGRLLGDEQCDNDVSAVPGTPPIGGDGCSSTCRIEPGWSCNPGTEPTVCTCISPGGPFC
jgi:cysteine-rich repeat protein